MNDQLESWPQEIYLQHGSEDWLIPNYDSTSPYSENVTWCEDSIEDNDVLYIRMDIHAKQVSLLQFELSAKQTRIDMLEAEVNGLQTALAFWLPNVPAEESEAAERCGNDAMLLIGLEDPIKPSAEELGWITLHAATEGWIPWRGGERPVSPDAICEFENHLGVRITERADAFDWGWDSGQVRIVAYRVMK